MPENEALEIEEWAKENSYLHSFSFDFLDNGLDVISSADCKRSKGISDATQISSKRSRYVQARGLASCSAAAFAARIHRQLSHMQRNRRHVLMFLVRSLLPDRRGLRTV
ncbi:MAG: hypothetical protein LBU32_00380 [Clostridiales bacterium]|nr:hypothetical protein [Clostridiales bacterium]